MELEYIEDIKDDVICDTDSTMKRGHGFEIGINVVKHENDYYMSDEKTIERDCHYIAIGAYAVETNNIQNVDKKVLKEIKRSIDIIESVKYDNEFTEEDKKYLKEDIKTIKNSELFK